MKKEKNILKELFEIKKIFFKSISKYLLYGLLFIISIFIIILIKDKYGNEIYNYLTFILPIIFNILCNPIFIILCSITLYVLFNYLCVKNLSEKDLKQLKKCKDDLIMKEFAFLVPSIFFSIFFSICKLIYVNANIPGLISFVFVSIFLLIPMFVCIIYINIKEY